MGGGGGGGLGVGVVVLHNVFFYSQRLRPEVQPLNLSHILLPFIDK